MEQKQQFKCHDCGKKIKEEGDHLVDAKFFNYKTGNEIITIIKCKDCYEKSYSLHNYKKCEVYSRVVGYLRPVQQWNKGKQKEFRDRKEFDLGITAS